MNVAGDRVTAWRKARSVDEPGEDIWIVRQDEQEFADDVSVRTIAESEACGQGHVEAVRVFLALCEQIISASSSPRTHVDGPWGAGKRSSGPRVCTRS